MASPKADSPKDTPRLVANRCLRKSSETVDDTSDTISASHTGDGDNDCEDDGTLGERLRRAERLKSLVLPWSMPVLNS
jgi:hypothetical protein